MQILKAVMTTVNVGIIVLMVFILNSMKQSDKGARIGFAIIIINQIITASLMWS